MSPSLYVRCRRPRNVYQDYTRQPQELLVCHCCHFLQPWLWLSPGQQVFMTLMHSWRRPLCTMTLSPYLRVSCARYFFYWHTSKLASTDGCWRRPYQHEVACIKTAQRPNPLSMQKVLFRMLFYRHQHQYIRIQAWCADSFVLTWVSFFLCPQISLVTVWMYKWSCGGRESWVQWDSPFSCRAPGTL